MVWMIGKILISACVISFCSWASRRFPGAAGFIVAMPLTTLLVLLFAHSEYADTEKSVQFAKSIFWGVPLSLLFFVPFLLANKLNLGFWACYLGGLALLTLGFFIHRAFLGA